MNPQGLTMTFSYVIAHFMHLLSLDILYGLGPTKTVIDVDIETSLDFLFFVQFF